MLRQKGFTLIELIVVIAIVGILVGISTGLYKGYTREANLSKHMSYVKELESASERYYMKNNDWPRGSDDPYNSEELKTYAERIRDLTGKEIELDPNGKYYAIDYKELSKYTKTPKTKENYILQNPVGRVYYLEDLTKEGSVALRKEPLDNSEETPETPQYKPVIFSGLSPEAFDGNLETYYKYERFGNISREFTWEGDLENREITIVASGDVYKLELTFRDINNNILIPIGYTTGTITIGETSSSMIKTTKIIVPKGAVKGQVGGLLTSGKIYEISVPNMKVPNMVSNISYEPSTSSIKLSWEQQENDYLKTAIYREGQFLGYVEGHEYTDTPLHSGKDYNYKLIAINTYGNASNPVEYKATTSQALVEFRGLNPEAFDGNTETHYKYERLRSQNNELTWVGDLENREITVLAYGGSYKIELIFRDINNKILVPIGYTSGTIIIGNKSTMQTTKIIVPEGAVKGQIDGLGTGQVHEISIIDGKKPVKVSNITHESFNNSIKFNWNQSESEYSKIALYREGIFVSYAEGHEYVDTPIYSGQEYNYKLISINKYGNASESTEYVAKTIQNEINFKGLTPAAFDGNLSTNYVYSSIEPSKEFTWDGDIGNREITVVATSSDSLSLRFMDSTNKIITTTEIARGTNKTTKIIVPIEAVKGQIYTAYNRGTIHDIYVTPLQ